MWIRTPGAVFRQPHAMLAGVGAVLVTVTSIIGSGFSPLAIPFALWSLLPYGLLWVSGRLLQSSWPAIGAGTAALAADLGIRAAVFVWPRGSTAAIALVFSPVYIAVLVMPVGAAGGWLCSLLWRWRTGRLVVGIVGPALLGLLTLGLARPDLFPTAVARRRAVLERVGPPRVVAGANTFESVVVSTKQARYMTGELDGQPGEEIAVVDHAGADLFDSTSLDAKARLDFPDSRGRLFGPFSTLVRMPDSRVVVAQTGGGFSRTLVQELNGAEIWEYRPDARLSPDALRPADVDGDGTVEFFSTTTGSVVRLDANGREVWRRQANLAALVATIPEDGETPAWVVGVEYGRRVVVWDADGRVLGERPVTAGTSPMAAVDFFAGRILIQGGRSARGHSLSGEGLFDIPLGDFTLSRAASARLMPGERTSLVLVGSTDRETSRYRLLIVGPDLGTVYDEVFDVYPNVITARRANGTDAVLIGESGSALRLLRPRQSEP